MLRTRLARIGLVISLLGIGVLGASLFTWNQTSTSNRLYYTTHQYQWVQTNLFDEPAVETDELWLASAECLKPFYMKAVQEAKTKLLVHNDTKPSTLGRDTRKGMSDFEKTLQIQKAIAAVAKQRGGPITRDEVNAISDAVKKNDAFTDSDWFPAQFNFESQLKQWESEASSVEDKKVLLSDVRGWRHGDIRKTGLRILYAKTEEEKIDVAAKDLLGLSTFSDAESKSIRATCVRVIPLKKIAVTTIYHTDLGRWPIEHIAPFWLGLGLVILGLFLSPVAKWIGAAKN